MVRKFLVAVVLAIACLTSDVVEADGIAAFAGRLQQTAGLYHDSSYNGRENVYWSGGNGLLGHRIAARAAWRNSPGHRANLPIFGLRVSRGGNGTYVVGRR